MTMYERLKIEEKAIPEVTMPISKFVRDYPAEHQACQTFTKCESNTQALIDYIKDITQNVLRSSAAIRKYLESLAILYSYSGEIEQAAIVLNIQKDYEPDTEPMRL